MKEINKIGILIAWPREIDMYDRLLDLSPEKIDIIVNDFKSFEKGRNLSNRKIIEILENKKVNFKLFSEVYKNSKYKVILSTGEISGYKLSLYSITRFIYGITIGNLINFLNISDILIKFFGRPFTSGGKNASLGSIWYPEKILGHTIIKYSDGMDIKSKNYPFDAYKNVFDIYFSYSDLEIDLIKKKFEKECVKIDYLRFVSNTESIDSDKLIKEFKLNPSKKIIYWLPTHIINPNEEDENLKNWIKKLNFLNKNYNIILRPHPKTITLNEKILKEIERLNFIVDFNFDQKIGEKMKCVDLILADYGAILFDAIYLKKKMILLNLKKGTKFEHDLIHNMSLDILLRKDIKNFEIDISEKEIFKQIEELLGNRSDQYLNDLKTKYFGKKISLNLSETKKFLESKLDI